MTFKDILVVTDDTPQCEERVNVAMHFATRYGAHVIGLMDHERIYLPSYANVEPPGVTVDQQLRLDKDTDARVREQFEGQLRATGLLHEWHSTNLDPVTAVSLFGRYADLTVVGQDNPELYGYDRSKNLAEHVVLASGRPVLVVPYIGVSREIGERVLIAWDASREAARAVADSLPILKRARSVIVLSVNPNSGRKLGQHGEIPGADLARHLARHGVQVEVQRRDTKAVSVAAELLNRIADEGIDLLVMGAYGHARLRELWLGGTTRRIMQTMTVPVFMSH